MAVNELELPALIFKGYLPEEDRNDAEAIKGAIEGVISDMAFDLQQGTSKRGADLLSERGTVKRVPRIREFGLQRVTILGKVLRNLKPTLLLRLNAQR